MPDRPMQAAIQQQAVRSGPRPLPLHLATANLILLSSLAVWPSVRRGSPPWNLPWLNPAAQDPLASLAPHLAAADPGEFTAALMRASITRLTAMTGGMLRYRRHEGRRALPEPPEIWREGGSRLLDYGPADAPPLLMVPSLVNRAYVLDLAEGQSLARYLAGQNLRPLLLDWGEPGDAELRFDLDAYIARLNRALNHVRQSSGCAPLLLGYCMGGNLALAAALRSPEDVAALALLATPWDFHAGGAHQAALVQALAPNLVPPPVKDDEPPPALDVDVLQGFFWALDPLSALKKFSMFVGMPEGGEGERRFVAMEDWINDGVKLAGPTARQCLLGWYGENTPPQGRWMVDGRAVRPQDWTKPALVVLPERDKLVPKEGAAVLLAQLLAAERLDAPSGHVGMVVGPRAEAGLWRPLADWLQQRSQPVPKGRGRRRHGTKVRA